jgi:dUTP pyrophosphatase
MDKKNIEEWIKKLQEMENKILEDDPDDMTFIDELNGLLNNLNDDVKKQIDTETNKFEVKIKKLHKDAIIPKYAKEGDAGLDLVATEIISNTTFDVTYGTGLAMEIPQGYVGLVYPRSSIHKYELTLSNSVGVIDSGYRGEIRAVFKKTNGLDSLKYQKGDRILQIIIVPYPKITFTEVDELSETERGEGGFGSTGT